jgi:hypothetical protein
MKVENYLQRLQAPRQRNRPSVGPAWPSLTVEATMTVTENIFLTWALVSGGLALIVATLILLFNSTTDGGMR